MPICIDSAGFLSHRVQESDQETSAIQSGWLLRLNTHN